MKFNLSLAQQFLNVKTMSTSLSSLGLVQSSPSLNHIVDFVRVSFSLPNLPSCLMVSIVRPLSSFFSMFGFFKHIRFQTQQLSRNHLQHLSSWLVPNQICLCLYPCSYLSSEWEFGKRLVSFVHVRSRPVVRDASSSLIISQIKYGIPPHDVRGCHL